MSSKLESAIKVYEEAAEKVQQYRKTVLDPKQDEMVKQVEILRKQASELSQKALNIAKEDKDFAALQDVVNKAFAESRKMQAMVDERDRIKEQIYIRTVKEHASDASYKKAHEEANEFIKNKYGEDLD